MTRATTPPAAATSSMVLSSSEPLPDDALVERSDDAREDWIVLEDCAFTSVASFDAATTAEANVEDVDPPSSNASNDCTREVEVMEFAAATLPGTEIVKSHSTLWSARSRRRDVAHVQDTVEMYSIATFIVSLVAFLKTSPMALISVVEAQFATSTVAETSPSTYTSSAEGLGDGVGAGMGDGVGLGAVPVTVTVRCIPKEQCEPTMQTKQRSDPASDSSMTIDVGDEVPLRVRPSVLVGQVKSFHACAPDASHDGSWYALCVPDHEISIVSPGFAFSIS